MNYLQKRTHKSLGASNSCVRPDRCLSAKRTAKQPQAVSYCQRNPTFVQGLEQPMGLLCKSTPQTMWEAWGCAWDFVGRISSHWCKNLDEETERFWPGWSRSQKYLIKSRAAFFENWETWAITAEKTAAYQEMISLMLNQQWRLQRLELQATQHYARVFLQEQESS